eukprot:6214329-Pleurochrysis_carterae.AAC.2
MVNGMVEVVELKNDKYDDIVTSSSMKLTEFSPWRPSSSMIERSSRSFMRTRASVADTLDKNVMIIPARRPKLCTRKGTKSSEFWHRRSFSIVRRRKRVLCRPIFCMLTQITLKQTDRQRGHLSE